MGNSTRKIGKVKKAEYFALDIIVERRRIVGGNL
jgi:hypothetical protein